MNKTQRKRLRNKSGRVRNLRIAGRCRMCAKVLNGGVEGFCSAECITRYEKHRAFNLNRKQARARPRTFRPNKLQDKHVNFLLSAEWARMRHRIFAIRGRKCEACGTTKGTIQVDHVKPRSRFPHLELTESNLQVLCRPCNMEKGTKIIDYRSFKPEPPGREFTESIDWAINHMLVSSDERVILLNLKGKEVTANQRAMVFAIVNRISKQEEKLHDNFEL